MENSNSSNLIELSIVVPVYNEEETVPALVSRLKNLLSEFAIKFGLSPAAIEIIFVNDGSSDRSLPLLIEQAQQNSSIKVINLSRNFGHQVAVTAGVELAKGNAVALIDGDLQDPPEFILDLYSKLKEGYDVVYAIRKHRHGESFMKTFIAKLFYRGIRKITKIEIPIDTGDFRIMGRKVVDVLNSMKEKHRFIRGMVSWVGLRQTGIYFERSERFAGNTKYPLKKMVQFAWDGITSFSTAPLRLVSYLGLTVAFLGFAYSIFVVYEKMYTDKTISGWSSIIIIVLFTSGINLITLGIIGEYIGRISEQIKDRPLYIIENIYSKNDNGV